MKKHKPKPIPFTEEDIKFTANWKDDTPIRMDLPIKDGAEVIVDRAAIPVKKYVPYDPDPNVTPYYGTVERSDLWDDGEYRYSVKIRGGRSIYPVRHRHLQIYKK